MSSAPDRYYATCESPVGELLLTSDGEALTGVFPPTHRDVPKRTGLTRNDTLFCGVKDQLGAYFRGRLDDFDVELAPRGTEFQRRVWQALNAIPCGVTRTYQEIADTIGRPSATRAVGAAIGKNPISFIIPCHRVVGASGALTGYAGGLELKRWLLDHEAGNAGFIELLRVNRPIVAR